MVFGLDDDRVFDNSAWRWEEGALAIVPWRGRPLPGHSFRRNRHRNNGNGQDPSDKRFWGRELVPVGPIDHGLQKELNRLGGSFASEKEKSATAKQILQRFEDRQSAAGFGTLDYFALGGVDPGPLRPYCGGDGARYQKLQAPHRLVKRLQKELSNLRWCDADNKLAKAKWILDQFKDRRSAHGFGTLEKFVLGGVDLESIRRLCADCYQDPQLERLLWREFRSVWGCLRNSPIHLACRDSTVSDDVVLHLASEMQRLRPRKPTERQLASCSLAFEQAMQRGSTNTLKLLQRLLEHWPQAPAHLPVLGEAMQNLPGGFVQELFEKYPLDASALCIHKPQRFAGEKETRALNLHQSKSICSLLTRARSNLQEVSIRCEWKPDAFLWFLECLQKPGCRSISKIPLLSVPSVPETGKLSLKILDAFSKALVLNPQLQIQSLEGEFCDTQSAIAWIRFLQEEGATKETDFVVFLPRSTTMAYSSKARQLSLGWEWSWLQENHPHKSAFVYEGLPSLNLQTLSFHGVCSQPVIGSLARFLKASPHSLQNLSLYRVEGSLLEIYLALRDTGNQTLVCFVVVQKQAPGFQEILVCFEILHGEDNTTLERCPTEGDDTIDYYLTLNRLGRAKARVATKRQMVRIVYNASRYEKPSGRGQRRPLQNGQDWFGMVYGLLREAPGLWSRGIAMASSLATVSESEALSSEAILSNSNLASVDSATPNPKRRLQRELQSGLNGVAWIPNNKSRRSGRTHNNPRN